MTMSPGEIERKVRQLDNDVQAIYVLLHEISATQTRHGNRLDTMDGRLDSMDARLDSMDARLDRLDTKVDALATSMTEVLRRLPER